VNDQFARPRHLTTRLSGAEKTYLVGFLENTAAPRQLLHLHQWLRKMVTHRIADRTILEVIGKWLNAGAMVDGAFSKEDPKFNCGQQDRYQRSL
jgi:hypothetical protein